MDAREERLVTNEALFRHVNERLRELDAASGPAETADFVCECADASCAERIALPLAEYERIRRDPARFFMRPGHEQEEIEEVVEEHPGYVVAIKRPGGPRETAVELAEDG